MQSHAGKCGEDVEPGQTLRRIPVAINLETIWGSGREGGRPCWNRSLKLPRFSPHASTPTSPRHSSGDPGDAPAESYTNANRFGAGKALHRVDPRSGVYENT